MSDYKSVQELIFKAAMLDGVQTNIQATELFGGYDVIELTFSKGDRYSSVCIDSLNMSQDTEDAVLYHCKQALFDLFKKPYEEIVCKEK